MLDLTQLREKIDSIDDQIVRLFEERMAVSEKVAQFKIETGKPVFDPEREKQNSVISAIRQRESLTAGEFMNYTGRSCPSAENASISLSANSRIQENLCSSL